MANDGTYPAAALVQGTNGKFYGTTQYGGTSGTGTVFEFDSSTETTLHNFNDGSVAGDGSNPSAALIQGIRREFLRHTQNGGSAFLGTVFEITPSGSVTIIHNFGDGTVQNDGANPAGSLYQGHEREFLRHDAQRRNELRLRHGVCHRGHAIDDARSGLHRRGPTGRDPSTRRSALIPRWDFGVLASADGANASVVTPSLVGPPPTGGSSITKDTSATSWTISGTENPLLPNYLTFNTTTGAITGVPLTAGTYTVIITPRNSVGAGDPETVTLYIDVPPMINSPAVAGGSLNTYFSYQTTATAAPSSFGAIGLPRGFRSIPTPASSRARHPAAAPIPSPPRPRTMPAPARNKLCSP